MREDLEHNFDIADWNLSQRAWKCGSQLFPHNLKMAEKWAIHTYNSWRNGGPTPEEARNLRAPYWERNLERYRRSQTKVIYY